jgi:hypothetical protein
MASRDDEDAHRAEQRDLEEKFDRWLREAVEESLEAQRKQPPADKNGQGAHPAPQA